MSKPIGLAGIIDDVGLKLSRLTYVLSLVATVDLVRMATIVARTSRAKFPALSSNWVAQSAIFRWARPRGGLAPMV